MKVNAGTVLLYNCNGPEYFKLKQIFAMLRLRMRFVTPDRYRVPLGLLAAGQGEAGEAEEPFPERMLVFCDLGEALFQKVLEVIWAARVPGIDFKVVLTETNREWDSHHLLEQLRQEREAIRAAKEREAAETAAEEPASSDA